MTPFCARPPSSCSELHAGVGMGIDAVGQAVRVIGGQGAAVAARLNEMRLAEDWQEALRLHEQLAGALAHQDLSAALNSIEAHLNHSLALALIR